MILFLNPTRGDSNALVDDETRIASSNLRSRIPHGKLRTENEVEEKSKSSSVDYDKSRRLPDGRQKSIISPALPISTC